MHTSLTLQSGALRCELAPALGGCVAGLWWGQQELLRSTPADRLQSVRVSASYPLVPYSNRIGQRLLYWAGKTYELAANFAPEPHSIHGVGWERAWSVASASPTQAVLDYRHQPDDSWPFAFDSRQAINLTDHALEMQLAITNRSAESAPAGLGWHPYFAKSAQTRVQFAAAARWDMDADKLPGTRREHPGLNTDCASLDVDHCFDGWNGALQLSEGGLRLQVTSDLRCLVVFTTPQRDSIAMEPVSHVNNALGLAHAGAQSPESLGMRTLQPGETFTASMRIQVEQTP
jgi:aldose 1-epimerase